MVRCQTPKSIYTFDYPAALEASDKQFSIIWPHDEIAVEDDLHCLRTELTDSELHGVMQVLPLFTKTELVIGNEYWGGRFKRMFPRPDFENMATMFSMIEICVHARFYSKIDEVLGLNTDEFYESFLDDPILKSRSDFVDSMVGGKDDALSIAAFSMVEGAVLYSAFAYLMHFQANTKNKIPKIVSGITFSVKDENLHSEAGAWAFRTLVDEQKKAGTYDESIKEKVIEAALAIYENEVLINKKIFEKGKIVGYKEEDANEFMKSRINLVISNLGIKPIFEVGDNPIAKWFYEAIGGERSNDFFYSLSGSYNRSWSIDKLGWSL